MASLAQQESQSLSQNVKLGLQFRYQQGLVQVNHNRFLDYMKDEEGMLVIEPEEAETVKCIYREYLEGASRLQIGKGLEADGILTAARKAQWRPTTLQKILRNEKYIGDILLQKTYTVDFLSKKRVKNNGIVSQYYVKVSHEAIIPCDLHMQVQEEMARRANLHSGSDRKKRVYSSKYALSSIVYCPKCGIFTAVSHGTTGASIPRCGVAAPRWNMVRRLATHRPSRNQTCRLRLREQSMGFLAAGRFFFRSWRRISKRSLSAAWVMKLQRLTAGWQNSRIF